MSELGHLTGADYMTYTPYIVYAIDSTTFSDKQGVRIIVSGGYFKERVVADEHCTEIVQSGLLDIPDPVGQHFSERAVAALIPSGDRVVFHYNLTHWTYCSKKRAEWLHKSRDAGFEVIEAANVIDDTQSCICVGTGKMLSSVNWLDENSDAWAEPILIASKQTVSNFETSLINKARERTDVTKIIADFVSKALLDPAGLSNEIKEYKLLAFLWGEDGNNLMIYVSEADITYIESMFSVIANDLGTVLYYAGSYNEPGETGRSLVENATCIEWRLIPGYWRRISRSQ